MRRAMLKARYSKRVFSLCARLCVWVLSCYTCVCGRCMCVSLKAPIRC
jgi:hypothetical protein